MLARTLICFPTEDAPGLRAEAAHLALGLVACGHEVCVLGPLGAWRHPLRRAQIDATEYTFSGETRKLSSLVKEREPQVIHAFGMTTAREVLPLALLVGAGGVVTLGHADAERVVPADLRTATTVFVPCDLLREHLTRRLPPSTAVVTTGYLLPPVEETPTTRLRFLAEELGVRENGPLILLADRFQGQEADVALRLIEAAPSLADRIPYVQILIAGDGARLGELEARAAEVNNRLRRRVVLLPGSRDDISQLLALATVAVGSGRFAMEAVGAGVALVAAGAAGMVGTFTEESASVAHFSCFGRHGRLEPVTAKALAVEIAGLFLYPQYREHFAVNGQAAVLTETERSVCAAQIAAYYRRSAPVSTVTRSPQRITAILPDDLRELLFTLPAISGIRAHYPLAHLRLIAPPLHRALLEQLGLAESVLVRPATLQEWGRMLRAQWKPRADVCLSFRGDFASAVMAALSFAPHRLGFAESGGSLFFSDHLHAGVPVSPARALLLTNSIGVSAGMPVSPPALLPETQDMVKLSLLAAGVEYTDSLILLCPHADDPYAWPLAHWQTLAQELVASRPERIVVLGGTQHAWPDGVVKVMPVQDSLVLATLLARAQVVIAADSAPLQLADLLGVPTIGLYGPTSPATSALPNEKSYPLSHHEYPCHPCGASPCRERHCLQALTPAEVVSTLKHLLAPVLV